MQIGLSLGLTRGQGGGVSYLPEAQALFARMTTQPDATRKGLINTLIGSLITAGVWSKLDALYVMAAHDAQAARRNWIADQYNLTALSSPTFTLDRGYQGDGVSAYLDTAFTPSTAVSANFVQNSASIGVWSRTDATNTNFFDIGHLVAMLNCRSLSANTTRAAINDSLAKYGSAANSLGHFVANRSSAGATQVYKDAVSLGSGVQSPFPLDTSSFRILAADTLYSGRQLAAAHIGGSLSSQNVADLRSAINTYLQAVGAT